MVQFSLAVSLLAKVNLVGRDALIGDEVLHGHGDCAEGS